MIAKSTWAVVLTMAAFGAHAQTQPLVTSPTVTPRAPSVTTPTVTPQTPTVSTPRGATPQIPTTAGPTVSTSTPQVQTPSVGSNLGPGWVADPKTGCHAYAEGAPPQVSMSWTGPCVNGKAHGRGQLSWFLGGQLRDTYDGDYQDGKMNGRGTLTSVDGGRYEGQFRNDKPEGQGIRSWPDGTKYDGDFKAGEADGMGTYWGPVEGGPKAGEWHAYKGQWRQGCFASPPYFAAIGSAIPEECEVLMGTR